MAAGRKGSSAQVEMSPQGSAHAQVGSMKEGGLQAWGWTFLEYPLSSPGCADYVLPFRGPGLAHPSKETDLTEKGGSKGRWCMGSRPG